MIFNAHFVLMSSQSLWLPMMSAVVMLIVGYLILGTRQSVNVRLSLVRGELSAANRLLGQSLHAQGNLDQAFAKYRTCQADESLLGQVYSLGLDYERKRQYNKGNPNLVQRLRMLELVQPFIDRKQPAQTK